MFPPSRMTYIRCRCKHPASGFVAAANGVHAGCPTKELPSPMRIDRLDLRNFRCFPDRTFTFDERFTLLVGANATGKTAILDGMAVALGAALLDVPDAPSRTIRLQEVRRTDRQSGEIGEIVEHYPVRVTANGRVEETALQWTRELRSKKSRTTRADTESIRHAIKRLVHRDKANEDVVFPFIGYYGTGRLWVEQRFWTETAIDPGKRSARYAGYRNCLAPTSSARRLVAWVKRLALIENQRRRRLVTLDAVYDAITCCVENAEKTSFDFDQDDIAIEFENGVWFPLRLLSDGQRVMAATVADIAMRCTQLNPHLKDRARVETPGVVLIDELDLHLHPRWQRRIVQNLSETFPRLQFVATSHSPFIIQSMSRGGVINLDREPCEPESPGEQSIEDVAENIMGIEQPQRSRRFQEMVAAAERYYSVLESAPEETDSEEVGALRNRLDELEEPFADNPAYVAFLRLQRTVNGL